ncbi:MAG: preprotein translocase subunit SecE [Coriobacteriia bacterium]|nr:preprotein translocase subunit SecE [Coriobacteriia bacterium]
MAKSAAAATAPAKKGNAKNTGKNPQPGIGARFVAYLKGVRTELKRVIWPSREEVVNSSIVVVVTLIFFATFAFLVDFVASKAILGLRGIVG